MQGQIPENTKDAIRIFTTWWCVQAILYSFESIEHNNYMAIPKLLPGLLVWLAYRFEDRLFRQPAILPFTRLDVKDD
jgi:hypothetical protein